MATFCSIDSKKSGAPLLGTAVQSDVWLLLEYAGPWRAKAIEDNALPPSVQAWFAEQTASCGGRPQFIKRLQPYRDGVRFYVAITTPGEDRLYRFSAETYDDLLNISVLDILDGYAEGQLTQEKLMLVCTNGKRDRCCAKFGLPIFQEFLQHPFISTWQTTHIGGHRYAPTAVTFPTGIVYGYLDKTVVGRTALFIDDDRIRLSHYRGRTGMPGPLSAADHLLRTELGLDGVNDVLPIEHHIDGDVWTGIFEAEGEPYEVVIRATMSEPVRVGCTKPPKPQPKYELIRYGHANQSS